MTDYHCKRCRKRIRVYSKQKGIYCACGARMQLGAGHRTHYDPWASLRIEGGHKLVPARYLRTRTAALKRLTFVTEVPR